MDPDVSRIAASTSCPLYAGRNPLTGETSFELCRFTAPPLLEDATIWSEDFDHPRRTSGLSTGLPCDLVLIFWEYNTEKPSR